MSFSDHDESGEDSDIPSSDNDEPEEKVSSENEEEGDAPPPRRQSIRINQDDSFRPSSRMMEEGDPDSCRSNRANCLPLCLCLCKHTVDDCPFDVANRKKITDALEIVYAEGSHEGCNVS